MQQSHQKERPVIDRRAFLAGSATAAIVVVSGALFHPAEAWALEARNLKPQTMKTLIKLARDIYPHDRFPDRLYAAAIKEFDTKSADAKTRDDLEKGIAELDAAARGAYGAAYADVGWEHQRVALLQRIEQTPFFQSVRSPLVVSLYNQKETWPYFGYQGESASQGGYINRGFNDITWL